MSSNNKPISKHKIKKIISCFCLDLTATQAAKLLGINRNTINTYFNKFRQEIYKHQVTQLHQFIGEIELDESYFGPRRSKLSKKGRGTIKQPVFGIFERHGRVYTEIVPDCTLKTLRAIIRKRIDVASVLYSDSWRGYDGLVDVGYDKHFRIRHQLNEYSNGKGVHINGIESFWSYTKRRLTRFNGVKKNFHLHLKESEWRWKKSHRQLESELLKFLMC